MRVPDFFLVGAPKCGTSSLHSYLGQHPEIFISQPKEPHYFSTDIEFRFRSYQYSNLEDYLRLFDNTDSFRCCGEASVWYLYSRCAAREIHRLNPNGKILAILRNPVDMMFSLYRFGTRLGGENIVGFREALAAEPDRLRGKRIPTTVFVPSSLHYRKVATYSEQIQRYIDLFGRENPYFDLR